MLMQVKQRSQAAQAQQRSGAVTPSNGPGSRPRRGRADVEDAADSQVDEPRRVRLTGAEDCCTVTPAVLLLEALGAHASNCVNV